MAESLATFGRCNLIAQDLVTLGRIPLGIALEVDLEEILCLVEDGIEITAKIDEFEEISTLVYEGPEITVKIDEFEEILVLVDEEEITTES
jgi:hypothetical protein